jgi:hypothetical protein
MQQLTWKDLDDIVFTETQNTYLFSSGIAKTLNAIKNANLAARATENIIQQWRKDQQISPELLKQPTTRLI